MDVFGDIILSNTGEKAVLTSPYKTDTSYGPMELTACRGEK